MSHYQVLRVDWKNFDQVLHRVYFEVYTYFWRILPYYTTGVPEVEQFETVLSSFNYFFIDIVY